MTAVAAPLAGRVVDLDDVPDDVFAGRIMGDGVAIAPRDGTVTSPVDGRIEKLFPGGHGIAIETSDGVQILIHIGLDTVELKGDGFTVHVSEGDDVTAGAALVTADLQRLGELGKDAISPVVVISGHSVEVLASGEVEAGDSLLRVLPAD